MQPLTWKVGGAGYSGLTDMGVLRKAGAEE